VDEAGLLSNAQMLGLLDLAQRNGCRLLLSGDRRQHSSVEAGDALRLLEQRSALRTVQLHAIRRQTEAEYRTAIAEIAAAQSARAFARLRRLGAIQEIDDPGRYAQLAADYTASLQAGKSALIITPTWRESEVTTGQVRTHLKQAGRLHAAETPVVAHLPLQWTEAQKRDLRNYQRGQVLLFHRATRDFGAGEWGVIERVDTAALAVRKQDGRAVTVTKKQSRSFELARRQSLAVAAGEQLLIQGNRREAGLLNGQIVTVQAVEPAGQLTLADGRTIPADFRTFNYGYCVTSPKSQGKTVDHVYVAVDAASGRAVNVKQFYVSASRGREQLRIYTDNMEWLEEQVCKRGTRKAALELVEAMATQPQANERAAVSVAIPQPGMRL
jgi:ATP-dependent exoDNAse (exonuclease V) alpha subunit